MTFQIRSKEISSIQLIDDNAEIRSSYKFAVEDLDAEANEITERINDIDSLIKRFDIGTSAVICDFNLKVKNYSAINGDEIVAGLYACSVPAVLCTRYGIHLPEAIRQRRRRIPVILTPDTIDADSLFNAFEICQDEFSKKFSAKRKPWRTVVRIEGGKILSNNFLQVNAVIPEWDSSTLISFEWEINGNEAIQAIKIGIEKEEIVRVFATVNVGADATDDLYVDEWSLKKTYA